MSASNEMYVQQMDAWLKEQFAFEKQLRTTTETCEEIAEQNKIQLQWHLKRREIAIADYNVWREENGLEKIELN